MVALRGATTAKKDDPFLIRESVAELIKTLYERNEISDDDVLFTIFSMTKDLRSLNAAKAAREAGFLKDNAIFCVEEADVEGSLPLAVRVLMIVEGLPSNRKPHMVYLREAASLRPDLLEG